MSTVKNRKVKLYLSFLIPLIVLLLPTEVIPIVGLTITQHRILAIFVLATLLWVLEPLPNYTTSVLVILLELILVSDKGLVWLRSQENLGTLLSYTSIFASFSAPIIILFIGGFALAIASQKYGVDFTLARIFLKPFGNKPNMILLGLMVITALFSMFMSNTATTAMMLSLLTPILASFPEKDSIKTAFALGIPFAANIGGMGTPIGTPPNAIALRILPESMRFTFAKWVSFATPFVIVLLLITWILLVTIFKSNTRNIEIKINKSTSKNRKKYIVYFAFVLTILLWITDFIHGMNSYIVAMVPLVIFFATGVLKKEDLRVFNWEVLWLVAGGIAIGYGMQHTGLAQTIVEQISFDDINTYVIIIMLMAIMYVISNFMSHTAASNLLFPIFIAIAMNTPTIVDQGLVLMLILSAVFASSLSMLLPISTPPNALGYATGLVSTRTMLSLGLIIGIIGMTMAFFYIRILSFSNLL